MQLYLNNFIAVNRQINTANWDGFKDNGSTIIENVSSTILQNNIIVNNADGNQKIYNEMALVNFISFDESYTPVSGNRTYNTEFVALVKESGATDWSMYKGTAGVVEFASDKVTFLALIRQLYGDGKFRIFQSVVQSHSHGFINVP